MKENKPQKTSSGKDLTKDLEKKLRGFTEFPYVTKVSFEPLIDHLRDLEECPHLIELAEKNPILLAPIENPEILVNNREVVNLLMTSLFSPGSGHKVLGRAMGPFSLNHFYLTPGLEELIYDEGMILKLEHSLHFDPGMTVVHAGLRILELHYGYSVDFEMPFIFSAEIGEQKKYFKAEMNLDFVDLKINGTAPEIDKETFNLLIKNIYNNKFWLEKLPPAVFEFHGFVTGQLFDVTQEEAMSRLKQKLLEKDGVLNKSNIDEMQDLLRTFFEIPDLQVGLTAIDFPLENAILHRYKIRYDFLADEVDRLLDPIYNNSVYHRACKYNTELIIEDLANASPKTELEERLIKKGIGSILIVPLVNIEGKIIGILEVGHKNAFGFNYFHRMYMHEITDLFRVAMERSRNEVDNQIEAIIREKYTAIHSSVEWKFIRAAYDYLDTDDSNTTERDVEEIVFRKVYPLFGQADIVSSSMIRGKAIREDMIENLSLIIGLLRRAKKSVVFPLIDKYIIDIEKEINQLMEDVAITNETFIINYIQLEIHPLLNQLKGMNAEINDMVSDYFLKLHPKVKLIFKQRKDYEDSVNRLNNILSNYLERAQKDAQKMIPHYFEKYKTDGVEYDMYVGQSILIHGKFDLLQLKNIRLWQLINMCELTKLSEEKGASLPVPLRTAQLIFVHEAPISIRFRSDEKQFDIDGAYNVRYEIIKKRIDKSIIVGTTQRLTEAGKIAIVYTAEADRVEYLGYIDYLKSANYIIDEVEDLEIEALQGVNGLRALRVKVKIDVLEKGNLKIA